VGSVGWHSRWSLGRPRARSSTPARPTRWAAGRRRWPWLSLSAHARKLATLLGLGNGRFAPAVEYSGIDPDPQSVAAGDLNGDGRPDVVLANDNYNRVTVFLNQGNGTLGPGAPFPVGCYGSYPKAVVLGDFTGDGVVDLATANFGWDWDGWDGNTLSLLVGLGGGTFAQPSLDYVVDRGPKSLAVADLDGDGQLDLVSANEAGTVAVLLRRPASEAVSSLTGPFVAPVVYPMGGELTGLFAADLDGDGRVDIGVNSQWAVGFVAARTNLATAPYTRIGSAPQYPRILGAGDFNGDGHLDFAIVGESKVHVFLALGLGKFALPRTYSVGSDPSSGAVADLNRDGKPDLAVASSDGRVRVLLGKGDGTFAALADFSLGAGPRELAVGDVDGDGAPDLVTANYGWQNVGNTGNLLLGRGDGTFGPAQVLALGPGPRSPALGDLDHDGYLDLVVVNPGVDDLGKTISVLFGRANGNLGPRTTYEVGTGPAAVALVDLNGDGHLDVVVANRGKLLSPGQTLSVLMGNGTGCLAKPQTVVVPPWPTVLAVGDFNQDGRPDLAVGASESKSRSVTLLLNATPWVGADWRLEVSLCGNELTVAWLVPEEPVVLEVTTDLLDPKSWRLAPEQGERVGDFQFLSAPLDFPSRFFRLRQP